MATIGVIGLLAADPRRRRWLDAGRATLLSRAILVAPTVYGEVGGDGWQAFVVARSVLLDHDLDLANDYAGRRAPVALTSDRRATSHLPIGLALVWTPPFILAHLGTSLAAALGASVSADGFSVPYRSAVTAGRMRTARWRCFCWRRSCDGARARRPRSSPCSRYRGRRKR